ncbi:MAG: pyruvate formate lyase family protein [Actinobacteria bacterium]|nr:pyruvate formate lyase family protein [Actinomycetota bacterium]
MKINSKLNNVGYSVGVKRSEHIERLMDRRAGYDKEKLRVVWSDVKGMRYGHATGVGFGEGITKGERMVAAGDQDSAVRVLPDDVDELSLDFDYNQNLIDPTYKGRIPSLGKQNILDPYSFADDYEALLEYSPAEIYPYENIVGEFHWSLFSLRPLRYPNQIELTWLRKEANEHGSDGAIFAHTCADVSIGLTIGWKGVLDNIKNSCEKFQKKDKKNEIVYLNALEKTCKAIIGFIWKHSEKAKVLAEQKDDEEQKNRYIKISQICEKIAIEPPSTFHEAVQWLHFYVMVERMWAGSNGYGHIDWYLYPFYKRDLEEGRITHDEAVELIAELFMKSSQFYSLGGRNKDGTDATNEVSWICLEAYDMVSGINNFGVMWHSGIDKNFFKYACDVVMRHGTGSPALVNYDVMRKSFAHYGVDEEDSWTVAYSGCYWYCIPGKDYNLNDMSSVNILIAFQNALRIAFEEGIRSYDELWELFCYELREAARTLKNLLDAQYRLQFQVCPEMTSSLMTHGCVENGRDYTNCGVRYNMTTVQMEGLANVADSLAAIKKLVFEEKKITLDELKAALDANYECYEVIRQMLLHSPKYGNDDDYVDRIAVKIVDQYKHPSEI